MTTMIEILLTVAPGDIVLIDTNYFYVAEVREPTHPAPTPGVVWVGRWWRTDLRKWGMPTALHMHEGKTVPHLLTPADREARGWGELP
jgi:hypothetical protein